MIHERRVHQRTTVIVECWRDGEGPVLYVAGPVYDEIARTRDETARWRLLKGAAIASRKKTAKESALTLFTKAQADVPEIGPVSIVGDNTDETYEAYLTRPQADEIFRTYGADSREKAKGMEASNLAIDPDFKTKIDRAFADVAAASNGQDGGDKGQAAEAGQVRT